MARNIPAYRDRRFRAMVRFAKPKQATRIISPSSENIEGASCIDPQRLCRFGRLDGFAIFRPTCSSLV